MIVLRTLVAVVLLLNGMAMPPATAMHTAAGATSHAGHDSPAPARDGPHDHDAAGMADGDCCEDSSCDCGCAVPHAVSLAASLPRTSWRTTLPEFTFVVKSFHSSPRSAPFRPPA